MNNWQKKESDKTNLPVVKNSFNNFEQRVYTDNEIEQRLNDRLTKKGFWLLYIVFKSHSMQIQKEIQREKQLKHWLFKALQGDFLKLNKK